NQLRQAAAAAREGSWALPTIDTKTNIRSIYAPVGPVVVFGPNNFPFAFNGMAGGDFAAAVAAGNPVIAKGHSSHPGTTRLFAEEALLAAQDTDMPPGFVQMIYRTTHQDGCRLVSHPKIGATGYTGSRTAGLVLKEAADRAGKPIYLELSSINPVFVLPGALEERMEEVANQFTASCLLGAGQFCTNPGLVIVPKGDAGHRFVQAVKRRFEQTGPGVLLSESVERSFSKSLNTLLRAGAYVVTGGKPAADRGYGYQNTLLEVDGDTFVSNAVALETEVFGNCSLFVIADDGDQMVRIAERLEGNLTGCIYSHTDGRDDALYDRIAPVLRQRVGRLLNDKMPTGVAVTPAMNHGGPYPATGHPGFTSVGIPASLRRFAMLQCYDNVRPHRLPPLLRDKNPGGRAWRLIDRQWTRADVTA
ncbi:MAG TPA: aldehyde dehydrogenase (NADP(+)), partial [Planctomycetaceae bacterium]|nr:aldehyde dehydrogenase (NADP(+)) [Planctomycetaceae bacterium]